MIGSSVQWPIFWERCLVDKVRVLRDRDHIVEVLLWICGEDFREVRFLFLPFFSLGDSIFWCFDDLFSLAQVARLVQDLAPSDELTILLKYHRMQGIVDIVRCEKQGRQSVLCLLYLLTQCCRLAIRDLSDWMTLIFQQTLLDQDFVHVLDPSLGLCEGRGV